MSQLNKWLAILLISGFSLSIYAQQTTNTVKIGGTPVLNGGSGTLAVTGSASDGTTATFSPVLGAGMDANGKTQTLLTSPLGALIVDFSATNTVTATLSPSATQQVTTALGSGSGTVAVVGSASDGTTATFSPVQTGGVDGSGNVQAFRTSTSGALVIDSTGTAIPVSFSAAASQVVTTTLNNFSGTVAVTGSASDGTTATFSPVQVGGVDVNGKAQALLTTTGGALVVDSSATSTTVNGTVTVTDGAGALNVIVDSGTTTVTQATGTNLHAVLDATSTTAVTQATGTNLHAVLDATSTTAVTQATGTNLHAVTDATSITNTTLGMGSGTLAVVGAASDGTNATFSPVLIGGMDANAKAQTILVTTGGALVVDSSATSTTVVQATASNLKVQATGAGTAGAADAGVLTVQFADSALPFQEILCPTNAFRIQGTTSVTGTTSSNIVWLRNNGTTTTFTSPPGLGLRFYIYSAQLVNSGATNVTVNLSADGAAGVLPTTLATWVAPTNTTPFGGSNMVFPSGMFTPTTARALSIVASNSSTTVFANVQGCLGP